MHQYLFPVSLLLLLVPHSKIHGTITGSDDGKHTKADAELGEIALENKLFGFDLVLIEAFYSTAHRIVHKRNQKEEEYMTK